MKLELSDIYDKDGELIGYQVFDSVTGDDVYFVSATEPLNGWSIMETIVGIFNAARERDS